jgi:gas vesicle protein
MEPSASDYVLPAVGILAVGLLAGAGIALLFAPMTGKKLREEVENKFMDMRSRLLLEEKNLQNHYARNNVAQPAESFQRG